MNRTPVYIKQTGGLADMRRIISVPNGLWVLQRHSGEKSHSNKHDPWLNERRPADFATALSQLKAFEPKPVA